MGLEIQIQFKSDKCIPLKLENIRYIRYLNSENPKETALEAEHVYNLMNKRTGSILLYAEDESCTFINLEDLLYIQVTDKR